MAKIQKSIELVISTEKRLSSMSQASRTEIVSLLEQHYTSVRISDVLTTEDIDTVIARKPDLVFLGMQFVPSTSTVGSSPVWLSQRLDAAGIAHTGSNTAAARLERNKQLAKHRVLQQGLATAASLVIKQGDIYAERDITIHYPIFVKPVDGGGGSGINELSLVRNFEQLKSQVTWLMEDCNTDALLESYLPGREFSVGILKKTDVSGYHLLPLEIIAPVNRTGGRFLSSKIKQADTEETLEITDRLLKNKLSVLALRVFKALGAKDYGRIDIRLDAAGVPHFLEANLLPSLLNNYGNLPKAAQMNMQMNHEQLILQITELGLSKSEVQLTPVISATEFGPISSFPNLVLN